MDRKAAYKTVGNDLFVVIMIVLFIVFLVGCAAEWIVSIKFSDECEVLGYDSAELYMSNMTVVCEKEVKIPLEEIQADVKLP